MEEVCGSDGWLCSLGKDVIKDAEEERSGVTVSQPQHVNDFKAILYPFEPDFL